MPPWSGGMRPYRSASRAATAKPDAPAVVARPAVINLRREIMLTPLACASATRNHGSHASPESGQTNHPDVDHKEEDKKNGDQEMNCACGLLAANDRDDGGERGRDSGRH